MKTIEQRLTALESSADDSIRVIRIGDGDHCDGPDEATARRNAGIPDHYDGQVIVVSYLKEPHQ